MLPKSVCRFSVRLLWCWRGPLSGAARGFVLYDVIVSNKLQAAKEETREGHVLSCSHRDWLLSTSVSLFFIYIHILHLCFIFFISRHLAGWFRATATLLVYGLDDDRVALWVSL